MKYLKYFWYVVRHKYYVGIMCFKMGLYWQGIIHDIHKFRLFPFIAYANHFYGGKLSSSEKNSSTGYSKPIRTGDVDFDYAWLLHQKSNPHHWQFWILVEDSGHVILMPMKDKYWKEMISDWYGASIATRKSNITNYKENTKKWYLEHIKNIQLNPFTKILVEKELGI